MPDDAPERTLGSAVEPETGRSEPLQRTRLTRHGAPLGTRRASLLPRRPGGAGGT
jgi:hypothetical protein